MRAIRGKAFIWLAWLAGLICIVAFVLVGLYFSTRTAQSIPPGTYLEQAKQLSNGKRETCLALNQKATDAVARDDGYLEWGGEKVSKFETAAGVAIADVPAGTNYQVSINSYENEVARGSMTYEKDFGTYNYEIKKLPAKGEWSLVSTKACKM